MRFIGNKTNLLEKIKEVIDENCNDGSQIFCDIFSGTGSVSRYFKPYYRIISNDLLYFSHILTAATIENNVVPSFDKLKEVGINDPFTYLETHDVSNVDGFATQEYSPAGEAGRMYLTIESAKRIDFIRTTVENWKDNGLIDTYEYKYLIAALIEGIPYVSNITGTYGAFLKSWDKRAFKRFELIKLSVVDNNQRNICYNEDANELIKKISGDILYIDPPYNERQYLPNYHLLETIAKYDSPALKGVTGVRPYKNEKSDYCIKKSVKSAFESLISDADFKHIVISYSDDGLLTADEMLEILKDNCIEDSVKLYKIPYSRYKSKLPQDDKPEHFEYIFYARKLINKPVQTFETPTYTVIQESMAIPGFDKKSFIKSPMNYIGGKYKLLPQLMQLFPQNIDTFIDLFAGGFNVAVNVEANKTICNDLNNRIVEMVRFFCFADVATVLKRIEDKIQEYGLTKENETGYKAFRDYYNKTGNPIDLFTLSCFSFNYQFRFNNQMEYNNPFGRNRSQFSETTKKNLLLFMDAMKKKNVEFYTRDFREISINGLGSNDFIYCDPPYLITTGSYNDGNRGFHDWGEDEERGLYEYLDRANAQGVKFALSNVMKHKGVENKILQEWARKYKIHYINSNYSNCSYQLKDKTAETIEVLITNY